MHINPYFQISKFWYCWEHDPQFLCYILSRLPWKKEPSLSNILPKITNRKKSHPRLQTAEGGVPFLPPTTTQAWNILSISAYYCQGTFYHFPSLFKVSHKRYLRVYQPKKFSTRLSVKEDISIISNRFQHRFHRRLARNWHACSFLVALKKFKNSSRLLASCERKMRTSESTYISVYFICVSS